MKRKTTINRVLTNLPFNPSLINYVSFYAKRLKQDAAIRRLGFLFIVLTFFVQMYAVIAPPQPSFAQDLNNDLIPGGFNSQADAVNHCNNNSYGYKTILNYYGISCEDVFYGSVRRIDYSEYGGQLYSFGRLPYGKYNEQAQYIPGLGTIYSRPLTSWGAHCYNDGKGCMAVVGKTGAGTVFMVLFSCGNLVVVGNPTPPPPPAPVKSVQCANLIISVDPGSKVKKGTVINVRGQVTGSNMTASDTVNMSYDYIDANTQKPMVSPSTTNGVHFSGGVANDPYNHSFTMNTPGHYTFRLAATYGGNLIPGDFTGGCAHDVFVEVPPVVVKCPYNPSLPPNSPLCKPCDKSQTPTDSTSCLILTKTARNDTQNIANADGTTAKAGDVITYTLSVKNTGKLTKKQFIIEENISDILDYADVTDYHGGVKDAQNWVRWPAVDVKPGQTVSKQLTVKIKNPIPQTPVSASNPGKYDMTMTNVYGSTTVNIKLPPTVIKTTEQVATTLPNTGPGTNIMIGFVLTSVVGYFFARSRLLARELDIVRVEYASGGM